MSNECGRAEQCGPCEGLGLPRSEFVCHAVAVAVQSGRLTPYSSLAVIRDTVWNELDSTEDHKITQRMRTGAFASATQLLNP